MSRRAPPDGEEERHPRARIIDAVDSRLRADAPGCSATSSAAMGGWLAAPRQPRSDLERENVALREELLAPPVGLLLRGGLFIPPTRWKSPGLWIAVAA